MFFGRVFDPNITTKFGMSSLIIIIDAHTWLHLFNATGIAYVTEVRDFYADLVFTENELSLIATEI